MLYCPKCQRLQPGYTTVCEICQESALREPDGEDMVLLAERLPKSDVDRLCATLSDAQIPFERKEETDGTCTAVFVRYKVWKPACDLVREIDLNPEGAFSDLEDNTEPSKVEEEPDASKKKLVSRILLFALFIGLVWAVVALSDTVIAFVKGLFTGG